MLVAILTAMLFALSGFCFIRVAAATGYWAVALFFSAVVILFVAFILLYALGIINVANRGDNK